MRLPRHGTVSIFQIFLTWINFRLKHPNIVALLEVFEDKTKVFLVMELWVTQWMLCFQFFWLFSYLSVGVALFSRSNSYFCSPQFLVKINISFWSCYNLFWAFQLFCNFVFISGSYVIRLFSVWRAASCLTVSWRRGHIPRKMQQILLSRCCLQWPTCMVKG